MGLYVPPRFSATINMEYFLDLFGNSCRARFPPSSGNPLDPKKGESLKLRPYWFLDPHCLR
jgi:hypothetical protein